MTFDDEGRLLVADCYNHRIQLLNSQLQLQRVLVGQKSDVAVWRPKQLHYNDLTSELHVVHSSNRDRQLPWSDVVSQINLRLIPE